MWADAGATTGRDGTRAPDHWPARDSGSELAHHTGHERSDPPSASR